MAAYLIAEISVEDPEAYSGYLERATPTFGPRGGRFLARGGATVTLEGDWDPERIVVLEFDSVEQARAWWSSPEYAEARALRQRSATTRMIIVEGVAGAIAAPSGA